MTKFCKHCQRDLPISEFGTHKKTAPNGKKYDFRRNLCKECHRIYENKRRKKSRKIYTKECANCGKEFATHSQKQMFCRNPCYRKCFEVVSKACVICGSVFTPKTKRHKYCSIECQIKDRPPKAPKVKKCMWCEKETLRNFYCSPDCAKMARRAKQRVREKKREKRLAHLPRGFTSSDWKRALEFFDYKCAYCGRIADMEQEHFVPVKLGGGYTRDNIVPACTDCNQKKRAKNPLDWLVMQPKGLVAYVRVKQYLEKG